jgi:oligosaccharide repeat unit polymerase
MLAGDLDAKRAADDAAGPPRSEKSPLFATLLWLLTVGLLPGILLRESQHADALATPAGLLNIAILVYAATRLSRIGGLGRPDWLGVCFYGFAYTWLGLAGVAQIAAQANPLRVNPSNDVLILRATAVLLGFIAFDLGRMMGRVKPHSEGNPIDDDPTPQRILSPRRVWFFSICAIGLTPWFIHILGGLDVLFLSREARTNQLYSSGLYSANSKSAGAIVTAFASVLPFLCFYGAFLIRTQRRANGMRRAHGLTLLLAVLIGINILLNNPISSSRFWFLVIVLAFVFSSKRGSTPRGVRAVLVGFVLASVLTFPYMDAFRYTDRVVQHESSLEFITSKTDYDSIAQIGNAVAYTQGHGFTYGRQGLGALFFFVPRSVWPDKPIDTGSLLAHDIGYPNENLSGPLWAELFIDFGFAGVAIGFLLLGLGAAALERTLRAIKSAPARSRVSAMQFAVPVLALYGVLILRGSLLQAMGRFAVLVFMLWLFTARGYSPERRLANEITLSSGSPSDETLPAKPDDCFRHAR